MYQFKCLIMMIKCTALYSVSDYSTYYLVMLTC